MKTQISVMILLFCLCACTKDPFLIPTSQIPKWLQDRITQDEKVLKTDPDSGPSITAWIRYKYNDSFYFEFHNMMWSSGPWYYDSNGNQLIYNDDPTFFQDYNSEKCCRQFVWKGPNYIAD
jgi:hypothetical protein